MAVCVGAAYAEAMADLPIFDDSQVQTVLCVVAHPDDMEYGGSAAVARWVEHGAHVSYLLLTAGEAGIRDKEPSEVGPLRSQEQRDACAAVGVENLTILDLPDGMLEYGMDLRKRIAREIRKTKPDTVVTLNWDEKATWGLNQADHRAAGLATLDAIRDADNPWVFRDLMAGEGLEPWGVTRLIVNGVVPDYAVELTEANIDAAVDSLRCHKQYLSALGSHPDPQEMITGMTADAGRAAGVAHALGIKLYELR